MRGSVVAFDRYLGRSAAALVVDGRLEDLFVDPPDGRIRPGAIYRARAGRPMKGQGGQILETPDGPLFLRQTKGIAQGEGLLVQVSTFAEAGKASPANARLVFKSRFCLVTPEGGGANISKTIRDEERRAALREMIAGAGDTGGMGLVLRTAAAEADEDAVREDIAATLDLARRVLSEPAGDAPALLLDGPGAEDLAWRDWPAPDSMDAEPGSFARCGADAAIDALASAREVAGETVFYVEATRALVAIDINTGGDTSPAAGLKANLAAIAALPRALRLRGLGGQIVVDPAPMPKSDRRRLEDAAKRAFRADPVETTLVGWTPLGHLELARKRERLPLSDCPQ